MAAAHVEGSLDLESALSKAIEETTTPDLVPPPHPNEAGTLLLTVGPRPLQQGPTLENPSRTTTDPTDKLAPQMEMLGNLFVMGFSIKWEGVYPNGRVVSLPLYPWQRQRLSLET